MRPTSLAPVSDLAEQIRGVTYPKEAAGDTPRPGHVPLLRAGNITDRGVVYNDLVYVPASLVSERQMLREHDVLVAASSGSLDVVGKAEAVGAGFEGSFGAFCKVLRPNKRVHPRYFAQFFRTPEYRRRISALAAGANINNIRNEHLDEMLVPLPPLPEQKHIAAILDKADAIRRKRQEAIRLTEELLRAAFLEMFGDPVTNPKGWEVRRLGDHISTIEAGWSASGDPRLPEEDEDAVLKISAVTSGTFLPDECKAVPRHTRDVPRPRRGDLLMSRANTRELVAATCLVEEDALGRFLPDKLWRVTFKKSLRPEYFRYLLWDPTVRSSLTRSATGTSGSMLNVSKAKLMDFEVPSPPPQLQANFGKVAWRAYDNRRKLRAAKELADELTAALTQRAFLGRL